MEYKSLEIRVGLTIFIASLILIVGLMWFQGFKVGHGNYQIHAVFPMVGGISPGDKVNLNGVEMGSVKRVRLRENDVLLTMDISRQAKIPDDSRIVLQTVGIMGDEALAVTEIVPTQNFFDYAAKYTDGGATHICPAQIPEDVALEARRLALLAHRVLGCEPVSRSDFRWDDSKPGVSGLCFLETNTQPGFTPLSLLPEQAAARGIAYADLCAWIVERARCHV